MSQQNFSFLDLCRQWYVHSLLLSKPLEVQEGRGVRTHSRTVPPSFPTSACPPHPRSALGVAPSWERSPWAGARHLPDAAYPSPFPSLLPFLGLRQGQCLGTAVPGCLETGTQTPSHFRELRENLEKQEHDRGQVHLLLSCFQQRAGNIQGQGMSQG